MEHNSINSCIEEWETLSNEYRSLEKLHKLYQGKLEEVNSLQQKCIKGISHQRYRLNIIKTSLKRLDKGSSESHGEEKERSGLLQTDLIRRKAQLYEMENILPKPSGRYLKIILGNINVSILDKNETFRYKDEYEKFKLVMSLMALGISLFNCVTNVRTVDLIHMFLLVWYYCTLTIRESILKVNGSRMRGWWRAHHFISTVLAGVMLIWPIGENYYAFRMQFMAFNGYISFVQYLQFMYQRGCLYRLKALGQSHNMDITVEGFQSWMWKGLSFLLPFLFIGYFWELYHSYTLYELAFNPSADWHEASLSALFMVLFLGNMFTICSTVSQKLKERFKLKYRFTRLDKYIWTHKRRRVSFRNPESSERRTPAARAASFSRTLDTTKETKEVPVSVEASRSIVTQVSNAPTIEVAMKAAGTDQTIKRTPDSGTKSDGNPAVDTSSSCGDGAATASSPSDEGYYTQSPGVKAKTNDDKAIRLEAADDDERTKSNSSVLVMTEAELSQLEVDARFEDEETSNEDDDETKKEK